jgi:hypothetical protein
VTQIISAVSIHFDPFRARMYNREPHLFTLHHSLHKNDDPSILRTVSCAMAAMNTTSPQSPQQEPTHCPLLDDLSPEIRLRIFTFALHSPFSLLKAHKDYPNETRLNTSLLRTNKQIYQEASEALFKTNAILLWRPSHLTQAASTKQQWTFFVRHLELPNVAESYCWLPNNVR